MTYDCFYTTKKTVKQGSKNISIKMLKNVGMTVPKSREASAVYIKGSKNKKDVGMTVPKSRETSAVYICSNTGLYLYAARQSSILYAPRQGMRACNNNMRNPSLHLFHYGVTHVIIVACPHPLSWCI